MQKIFLTLNIDSIERRRKICFRWLTSVCCWNMRSEKVIWLHTSVQSSDKQLQHHWAYFSQHAHSMRFWSVSNRISLDRIASVYFKPNAAIALQSRLSSLVCLWRDCIVTKRLNLESRGFHLKVLKFVSFSVVNLIGKFEGSPLDFGARTLVGWFPTSFAALYLGTGGNRAWITEVDDLERPWTV